MASFNFREISLRNFGGSRKQIISQRTIVLIFFPECHISPVFCASCEPSEKVSLRGCSPYLYEDVRWLNTQYHLRLSTICIESGWMCLGSTGVNNVKLRPYDYVMPCTFLCPSNMLRIRDKTPNLPESPVRIGDATAKCLRNYMEIWWLVQEVDWKGRCEGRLKGRRGCLILSFGKGSLCVLAIVLLASTSDPKSYSTSDMHILSDHDLLSSSGYS